MAIERYVGSGKVIDGVAVLSLALVGLTVLGPEWWLTVSGQQSLTWLYDLSLAYIAGWIFHLLVVVLPKRREHSALLTALAGPLSMFAGNGRLMMAELEFVGECPALPLTPNHVQEVLRANTLGALVLIKRRAAVMHQTYNELIPYLTVLDPGLVRQIQRTKKTVDVLGVDASYEPAVEEVQYGALREQQYVSGVRLSLVGYERIVFDYCAGCEKVQGTLDNLKIRHDGEGGSGSLVFSNLIPPPGYQSPAEYPRARG